MTTTDANDLLELNDRAGMQLLGSLSGPDLNLSKNDDVTALASLRTLYIMTRLIETSVREYVDHARGNGASWAQIGRALDLTRQAAQQRYGAHD